MTQLAVNVNQYNGKKKSLIRPCLGLCWVEGLGGGGVLGVGSNELHECESQGERD